MAFGETFAKFCGKFKGLFAPEAKITLSHLQETGEKTMRFSGKVLGKDGKPLARIEQYTQPVQEIGMNNTVLGNTSINTRLYRPAPDSNLNKLGIEWVETTRTPHGSNVKAAVRTYDGSRIVNGHNALKAYVQLMK